MTRHENLIKKLDQMRQDAPGGRHHFGGRHRRIVDHKSGAVSVACIGCGRSVIATDAGVIGTATTSKCTR